VELLRLRPEDHVVVPWKNGGGTTREVVVRPSDAGTSGFAWRLSIASVEQDGPFSSYPGVDRTLLLLQGAGMTLTFSPPGEPERVVRVDRALEPVRFDGAWPARCALLGGPVRDLNLMVDRARASHLVELLGAVGPHVRRLEGGASGLLHALAGRAAVEVAGQREELGPGETLVVDVDAPADVRLTVGGVALWAALTPR
jgi:uncharacterized protein